MTEDVCAAARTKESKIKTNLLEPVLDVETIEIKKCYTGLQQLN